jgi:hypothetical protein
MLTLKSGAFRTDTNYLGRKKGRSPGTSTLRKHIIFSRSPEFLATKKSRKIEGDFTAFVTRKCDAILMLIRPGLSNGE